MTSVLCIVASPPYSNAHTVELLEAALVAAAFDQPTSVLFRGAGVLALNPNQNSDSIGSRNVGKMLTGLATYDIERVFVCSQALDHYGLATADLVINAAPVEPRDQGRLISEHNVVIGDQA